MKILVVSQYYYPEQFRVNDICEELVKRGHNVTVLTGLPNYPEGKIYEGYKNKKNKEENINGVKVIRCNIYPRKKGTLNLALNYISFAFNASMMVRKLDDKFDLVYVYQLSPVFMALPAIKVKRNLNIPINLYCFDLWPASILDSNVKKNGLIYNIVKEISRYIYKQCDEITVTSPSFISYFIEMFNMSKDKFKYIPQYAEDIYNFDQDKIDNGIIDFMFLGNIGKSQNCDCIIEAVNLLDKNLPFKVHFVGDGSMKLSMEEMVNEYKLQDKIIFYGFQPLNKLQSYYDLADVCLLTLSSDNEIGMTIPAKLQGYMAAKKPVVAAICGDAVTVINDSQCGFVTNSGNYVELANIMRKCILNKNVLIEKGINARKYYLKHFNKEKVMDKIEYELIRSTK